MEPSAPGGRDHDPEYRRLLSCLAHHLATIAADERATLIGLMRRKHGHRGADRLLARLRAVYREDRAAASTPSAGQTGHPTGGTGGRP